MLWIEKYRPTTFGEIVGQEHATSRLRAWAAQRNLPHLLLSGPHGTGKSAAIECLARELYADQWEVNLGRISASLLFLEGRSYLEGEERFSHLYRKEESLISNFKRIARWYSSLQPFNAPFRLMVFEEAEALTFEAQQALRRVMEQYHRTCRFVYSTTRPSAIIPAIASRCHPLHLLPLAEETVLGLLRSILEREGIRERARAEDLELIAKASGGDARRAITVLQVMVETHQDLGRAISSGVERFAASIVEHLAKGDIAGARRGAEALLLEEGITGNEALLALAREVRRTYNLPEAILCIALADAALAEGGTDFVQLNALLASLGREVFHA